MIQIKHSVVDIEKMLEDYKRVNDFVKTDEVIEFLKACLEKDRILGSLELGNFMEEYQEDNHSMHKINKFLKERGII